MNRLDFEIIRNVIAAPKDTSMILDVPMILDVGCENGELLKFLNKLKIDNLLENFFWPCDSMKLYAGSENEKFREIFEINRNKKEQKHIFYMAKNSTLVKSFIKNIKKNKLIEITQITNINIENINEMQQFLNRLKKSFLKFLLLKFLLKLIASFL